MINVTKKTATLAIMRRFTMGVSMKLKP